MWIEIDKSIFQNSDFKGLNFLYQILSWYPEGSMPRYHIFIDLNKVKATSNYESLKRIEKNFDEYIQAQFDEFVTSMPRGAKTNYKIAKHKGNNHFNVEEAIHFFNQPVSVILENGKNDSSFIAAIIKYFGDRSVKEHLKNSWIHFENAGGCTNIENFTDEFLSRYEHLAQKNDRKTADYFRGIIILDSDLAFPADTPKHTAMLEKLELKGITGNQIHILQKRMMENYMPDEVFARLKTGLKRNSDLVKWIDVYSNLSPSQKDYLKYYDGFDKKLADLPTEVKDLYNNQNGVNFDILKLGFKYEGRAFKNKFPLLFLESHTVNKNSLKNRCGSNELETILKKITDLL